jgi:hypothetical protein
LTEYFQSVKDQRTEFAKQAIHPTDVRELDPEAEAQSLL